MKNSRPFVFLLIMGFVFLGCLTEGYAENDNDTAITVSDGQYQDPVAQKTNHSNPYRKYYRIVIVDDDEFEICLNMKKDRKYLKSYGGSSETDCCVCTHDDVKYGILFYYLTSSIKTQNEASAVYDQERDLITVSAVDAVNGCAYGKRRIIYSLKFINEESNDLRGYYFYAERPKMMNVINARLVQGTIGPHDAGWGDYYPYGPSINQE